MINLVRRVPSHMRPSLSVNTVDSGRYQIFLPSLPGRRSRSTTRTFRHQQFTAALSIGKGMRYSPDCPGCLDGAASVAFYGDQILSRACHDNVIVLWRIEGFSSDDPPPAPSAAPTLQNLVPTSNEDPGRLTRSAFVPTTSPACPAQYTRLLEFDTPNCGPQFFMRFKLHHVPGQNPVLAFCNASGNIFFWDLARLSAYRDIMGALREPRGDRSTAVQLPGWLKSVMPRQRGDGAGRSRKEGSDRDSMASGQTGPVDVTDFNLETLESWASRYNMEDPQEPLRAHKTESSSANFVGRQAAWSPGGEWCVVVGSSNTTLVLQRWARRPAAPAQTSPTAAHGCANQ